MSLRSVAICVIDGQGKVVFERSDTFEIADVVGCLEACGRPLKQIGFEAGAMSQHLYRCLKAAGYDVVCMEAR